jgi:hypothetical protein
MEERKEDRGVPLAKGWLKETRNRRDPFPMLGLLSQTKVGLQNWLAAKVTKLGSEVG